MSVNLGFDSLPTTSYGVYGVVVCTSGCDLEGVSSILTIHPKLGEVIWHTMRMKDAVGVVIQRNHFTLALLRWTLMMITNRFVIVVRIAPMSVQWIFRKNMGD